jgi:O-antigen ligase
VTSTEISEVFFRRASLTQKYDVGAGGRFETLLVVVEKIIQNPIGIGPGESLYALDLDPHNLYIHITSETGWLGGFAFCSFLLVTVWKGFLFALTDSKLQGPFIVVFSCLVGTLIESMIIHSTHWRHLYLLLAMVWGAMVAQKKIEIVPEGLNSPLTIQSDLRK